jgi:hypothetical protein
MNEMTSARFTQLVDAYGAELGRWPEGERMAAHDFTRTNPEASALLAEAGAIDALLAHSTIAVPDGLTSRVLAQCAMPQYDRWNLAGMDVMPKVKGAFEALWPGSALWKPASVFVSALVMGVVLAFSVSLPANGPDSTASDDVLALATPVLAQDVSAP